MFIIQVRRKSSYLFGTYGETWISDAKGKNFILHSNSTEPHKRFPKIRTDIFSPQQMTHSPPEKPAKPKWYPQPLDHTRVPPGSYELGMRAVSTLPDYCFSEDAKPTESAYVLEILVPKWEGCYVIEGEGWNRLYVPYLKISPPRNPKDRFISLLEIGTASCRERV